MSSGDACLRNYSNYSTLAIFNMVKLAYENKTCICWINFITFWPVIQECGSTAT